VKRAGQILGWCALSACVVALPRPAAAQTFETPAIEIAAGVQSLKIPGEFYPFGFNVDLSGPAGDHERVRWVAEGGMAQDRPIDIGQTLRVFHFGAGVRFTPVSRQRATPYFQIIGGVANSRAAERNPIDSSWGPMVQPGVGVNVPLTRNVAAFGQADYRWALLHPVEGNPAFGWDPDNEFRFAFGVRFMLW
jgi:hypothetical protein